MLACTATPAPNDYNLNSNIEIHKFSLKTANNPSNKHLNSNIEIHKFFKIRKFFIF